LLVKVSQEVDAYRITAVPLQGKLLQTAVVRDRQK